MRSDERKRRPARVGSDSLGLACLRAAAMAPGGFVAGYLVGRAAGRLVSGCAFAGPCDRALPVLTTVVASIVGLGFGGTLATTRVQFWWEAIVVWVAAISATFGLLIVVGAFGSGSWPGRMVALGWFLAAVGAALYVGRPPMVSEDT
jgi:hypothetical protein